MQVPETESEQKRWLAMRAREVLQSVPVRSGDVVLDFGCGAGAYALPAAEMVGPEGVVYAVDCSPERIEQLRRAAGEAEVARTQVMLGDGEVGIPLADGSCDVALLYDMLQNIEPDERDALLADARRVLRPGGVLSVYPMHLGAADIRARAERVGLRLRDDYAGLVLHFVKE